MAQWTYVPSRSPPARIQRRVTQWLKAAHSIVAPDRPVVTFTFDDFGAAERLVGRVADDAPVAGRRPAIDLRRDCVTVAFAPRDGSTLTPGRCGRGKPHPAARRRPPPPGRPGRPLECRRPAGPDPPASRRPGRALNAARATCDMSRAISARRAAHPVRWCAETNSGVARDSPDRPLSRRGAPRRSSVRAVGPGRPGPVGRRRPGR